MLIARLLAVAAALTLAACASAPPPRSLAQASQAVDQAGQSGAAAAAPLEMQLARDKLAAALAASVHEENAEADRLAQEAIASAELAQAKTEDAQSRAALTDMQRAIDALRSESARPPAAATAPLR
jgi:hypothetical protein